MASKSGARWSKRVQRIVQAADIFANKDRTAALIRLLEAENSLPAGAVWSASVSNSSRSKHLTEHLAPFVVREQKARNRDSDYEIREEVRDAVQRVIDALDHLSFETTKDRRHVTVSIDENGVCLVDGQPINDTERLFAAVKEALRDND